MSLKTKLQNGEALNGTWLNSGMPISAEILGTVGFDWILIDLEHGAGTEDQVMAQLQALNHSTSTILARVENAQAIRVQRLLDFGIQGIMFPRIKTVEEAKAAISSLYYPPRGIRGLATMTRATRYGHNIGPYLEFSETGLLGIIQIETLEALEQSHEIAALEGVDILFLGPSDLSLAMGIYKQWDHPRFLEAIQRVGQAAQNAGKAAGTLLLGPSDYGLYYDFGYRFLAAGSDLDYISKGSQEMVQQLKEKRQQHEPN